MSSAFAYFPGERDVLVCFSFVQCEVSEQMNRVFEHQVTRWQNLYQFDGNAGANVEDILSLYLTRHKTVENLSS